MGSTLELFRIRDKRMLSGRSEAILFDGINLHALHTMDNTDIIILTNFRLIIYLLRNLGLLLEATKNLIKVQVIIVGLVRMPVIISMCHDTDILVAKRILININTPKH